MNEWTYFGGAFTGTNALAFQFKVQSSLLSNENPSLTINTRSFTSVDDNTLPISTLSTQDQ